MFFKDLIETLKIAPVWVLMSKYDIIARYRRTAFGPWWITLGTGCALLGMGFVWSKIFNVELKVLFPYLSIGYVFWVFIASVLTESSLIFISHSMTLRTVRIPILTFIFNALLKNIIMLLHNVVIVIIVFFVFDVELSLKALLFIPGFILTLLTSFFVSLSFALLGARLRDLSYIVTSLVTFIFLLTPIMWKVEMFIGNQKYIAYLNPLTHFITILRDPLLNKIPDLIYYYGSVGTTMLCGVLAIFLYNRMSKNIIYWL